MRTDIDLKYFEGKLGAELIEVEAELKHIGSKNPKVPGNGVVDWEAKPADFDTDHADDSEMGDKIEEFEENSAVLKELEIKYNQIKEAISRIKDGSFGTCKVCGEYIPADRLEANPSASTCKLHMDI